MLCQKLGSFFTICMSICSYNYKPVLACTYEHTYMYIIVDPLSCSKVSRAAFSGMSWLKYAAIFWGRQDFWGAAKFWGNMVYVPLALSPGPLRGGERDWYTLYAHVQSLRKFFQYNSSDTNCYHMVGWVWTTHTKHLKSVFYFNRFVEPVGSIIWKAMVQQTFFALISL